MKNIHVLPTEKPDRLYKVKSTCKLGWSEDYLQNIYITSDEGINENDYIITKDGRLVQVSTPRSLFNRNLLSKDLEGASKVILTTDQDLIKDGVQAIDDEFLEWFVKNPSCEKVEVEESILLNTSRTYLGVDKYKIIIPKEEPDYTALLQSVGTKQETLEESAENNYYFESDIEMVNFISEMASTGKIPNRWSAFVAKINELYLFKQEQDKKMYSEEEVLSFGKSCFYKGFEKAENDDANCYTAFREEMGSLVEQFKNK
jgi:hypothetical protein